MWQNSLQDLEKNKYVGIQNRKILLHFKLSMWKVLSYMILKKVSAK